MRKLIAISYLLLFHMLLAASCASPEAASTTWPDAAQLPAPNTATSTPLPPTDLYTAVPPTFYYTPPPVTATNTAAGTSTATHEPGPEDYHISTFEMVDDQHGWAVFTFNGMKYIQDGWLGRTTDGGKTWTNITPHAIEAIRDDPAYHNRWGYLSFEVLDSENAWVFPTCSSTSVHCDVPEIFWRTRDGGRSWQTLHPPMDCQRWRVACVPWQLQFIDDQYGWVMMLLSGRNYAGYSFYRTIDGGESWTLLPGLQGAIDTNWPAIPVFFSPNFGIRKNSWSIRSPVDEIDAEILPTIQLTQNSGDTWREITLPEPEGLLQALQAMSVEDIEFLQIRPSYLTTSLEPNLIGLQVRYGPSRDDPPSFHTYYFSSDRGLSWQPLSLPGDTYFADDSTGWRVVDADPSNLEQTLNGGLTWEPFPREGWEDDFDYTKSAIIHITDGGATRIEISTSFNDERLWAGRDLQLKSLNMQSSTAGWAAEVGSASVCTQDGARTWIPCVLPEDAAVPPAVNLSETEGNWLPDDPLPEELFHGAALPSGFQAEIARSRKFLDKVDEYYNPFEYNCTSVGTDRMANDWIGVSRQCQILYPIGYNPSYGFERGYWIYRYYVLFQDTETTLWPSVVGMNFIDRMTGWRLLDMGSGLYRIEATQDSGSSWRTVKTVAWAGQLDFVSAEEGWAIARQPPERGIGEYRFIGDVFRPISLLHTTDGGRTWQEIVPVIGGG